MAPSFLLANGSKLVFFFLIAFFGVVDMSEAG